jgi:hypothetical protein
MYCYNKIYNQILLYLRLPVCTKITTEERGDNFEAYAVAVTGTRTWLLIIYFIFIRIIRRIYSSTRTGRII